MTTPVRRITARHVAREAGVSVTTVSDTMNGTGRLSAKTRERVLAVAAELGYRPRASARRLREGRSGQIGLYCSFLTEIPAGMAGMGYYMALAMGAAEVALERGLGMVLLPTGLTPDALGAIDVDGLVVADPVRDDEGLRVLSELGLTVVTVGRDPTPGAHHAGCVRTDDRRDMQMLLDHVAARGARRIAFVRADIEAEWTEQLTVGYREWCSARGAAERIERIPVNPEAAAETAIQLLDQLDPPDAIICGLDGGAAPVVRAVQERGLRVPEDLLVSSCVDGPLMTASAPAITSIDLQPAEVGRRSAALLASILEGAAPRDREQVLETRLIVRASTGGLD
ncbi:LacI family DNA-binding transcriptional regulator [Kribbella sp. NPDC050124]|uniref:LacI family DNA-binding transcriptional regulator n=1 Tax=Kribbella sp. NPDC050124 TaxID=3364114 RepID=UPI00378BBA5A